MPRVLITIPDHKEQPYRFSLDRKEVAIGRGSSNDIVIDCPSVSANHAVMERLGNAYQLRDLGSTNGTKTGDVRKEIIPLQQGSHAKLGDVSFVFTLSEEEQEALASIPPEEPKAALKQLEPEEPPTKPIAPRPVVRQPAASSSGGGFFSTMAVFLLIAFAFYLGLSIRYAREMPGHSLLSDIRSKSVQTETEQAPAESAEPAPLGEQ